MSIQDVPSGQSAAFYREILALSPENALAHFYLGMQLLRAGQYAEGWREYEWRKKCPQPNCLYPHILAGTPWVDQSLEGKRLFIHSEQGFGDVLQLVRYFKCLKQLGAAVILEVREALASLLTGHPHIDQLVVFTQDRPTDLPYDYHVSIMDLPGRLGTTLETIPASEPRLSPTERLKTKWMGVRKQDHLNIGVVFSGSPHNPINPQRSFPAALLQPIAAIPGLHCVSLQKGPPAEQLAELDWELPDIGRQCQNFSDTAGVVENLDLVISMCTSVAHLAGIMHKPVWVLLAHRADWRWHLNTAESPWYPTARLFRQARPGDWASVFDQVYPAVAALVAANNT